MFDKKIKKYRKTKLESYLTGVLFCVIFFSGFLVCQNALAANICMTPDGAGSKTGSDWTNAKSWNSTIAWGWARGNTYYLAGGIYTSGGYLQSPASGAAVVVKKATASDHATDVGWQSSYGTDQAVFTHGLSTSMSDITINGVTGTGSDISSYGFVVEPAVCNNTISFASGVSMGAGSVPVSQNVEFEHIAVLGCSPIGYPHDLRECTEGFTMNPRSGSSSPYNFILNGGSVHDCYSENFVNSIGLADSKNLNIYNNYFKNTNGSPIFATAITFNTGTTTPVLHTTYYAYPSGALLKFESAVVNTGTWNGTAAGIMYYEDLDGGSSPQVLATDSIYTGVGGTGNLVAKATSSPITITNVTFNTGTNQPIEGQTYYGATSGATIIITSIMNNVVGGFTGSWDGTGAGVLYYLVISGHIVSGEGIWSGVGGTGTFMLHTTSAENTGSANARTGQNYCHSQHTSGICTSNINMYDNYFGDPAWAVMAMHAWVGGGACDGGLATGNFDWNFFNNIIVGSPSGSVTNAMGCNDLLINGIIGNSPAGVDHDLLTRFNLHHNTIVNFHTCDGHAILTGPIENVADAVHSYNNLYYNSTGLAMTNGGCIPADQAAGYCDANRIVADYNAYLKSTGYTATTNNQVDTNASNPLNADYTINQTVDAANAAHIINTGKTGLGSPFDVDAAGNVRDATPDIGAYEYVSGTTDTTPPSAPSGLSVS